MAIRTGRNKGGGARAERAASNRRNSKDVPRFAPNFSVYLLPPNTVCLYSEDRKFFLHGELYCALASAIAEGGRTSREIVTELARHFPPDKVQEAFKRLVDRRYAVLSSNSLAATAAAYWASLGLAPEDAEAILQNCRVGIQAIDVEGAAELGDALGELGVQVVKRSPDLTVTLVNDYLDERLADVNRQHLSDRSPWLLAQPSGIFPLVGPVFRPRDGACWVCLAERMKRNREIKAMLNRAQARCIALSALTRNPVGSSGIELAAVEIAKAIATDFRTDLRDHVVSLDLSGATVVKHYVSTRPQCPACGRKELRDPGRTPVPLELGPGGKLVMTSGGYRTVSSRATVARYRKHVSPLCGVVSRLDRVEADIPLNTNFYATHNYSAPAETVNELRAGLGGGSFGKGSTAEQGEASALMEAMERYSGVFQGDEIRVTRRFADFPPGDAILPNDVMLFSDKQYRHPRASMADHHEAHPTPPPFDRSAEIEWSPVWSLRDERFKYVPTGLLYVFYRGSGAERLAADTNGCAAGNTIEEAIVQGFLELVERDSYAIWWYNRLRRPEVDLSQFDDSYIRELKAQLAETGRRVWVLDVTNDLGIPSYVAISHWEKDSQEGVEFGSGSHFDPRIALLRALTELNQFLSIAVMTGVNAETASLGGSEPVRLRELPFLSPGNSEPVRPGNGTRHHNTREQVLDCVRIAKRAGLDFLVLNQTRPDIEVPVVKVVVPGLRHFYRRFAPGRLYDIPVKLGWRDRPLSESELNPLHPHT